MSDDPNHIDKERFFHDPEYRKKVREQQARQKHSGAETSDTLADHKRKAKQIALATVLIILTASGFYINHLFQGLPSIEELENPETAIASTVMSRDGAILDRYFIENRTYVPIDEISPNIVNALIATEDHRFFTHWGLDIERIISLPYYWIQGQIQGGSTISQQLARNLYRKIGREVSVTRKLKEMITAIQIEQNYTKREIIEMYLNTVEFANSAFGIESAAQTHYSRPASDITVSDAANDLSIHRTGHCCYLLAHR